MEHEDNLSNTILTRRWFVVYTGRSVRRVLRTVHNNSPRTVRGDPVRKYRTDNVRMGPQLRVSHSQRHRESL